MKKQLKILRGCPSSGKTFLAQKMKKEGGAVVFSNDELLTARGIYKWNEADYREAHRINQWRMAEAMRDNIPLLVLDNTNLLPYHCTPHVRLALYYEYSFEVIEPDTPWRLDVDELVRRNTHGIPKKNIEQTKENLLELPTKTLLFILNCERPTDPDVAIREAQIAIENNKYSLADEKIIDYNDWRRIGGYEPDGGDETSLSIDDKLMDWRNRMN